MGVKIEVQGVSKSYKALQVLDNWNITIHKGERIVLVGPSGAGKTTFLRILAGIDHPTAGTVQRDSNKIGFVFQEPRLIPWRTVKQNLLFVSENGPVDDILKKLRLDGFEDYFPYQLSGGMKQRVNLARGLIVQPDLLIMDEAFSSLDIPVKISIMNDLITQWESHKFTVVAVTHDLKEALFIGDRILVISGNPARIIKEFGVNLHGQRKISSPDFLKLEANLLEFIYASR